MADNPSDPALRWRGKSHHRCHVDYQIAAGHHRIKAMKDSGFTEVELIVDDYDDDQMIQIMVMENSSQIGDNSGAVLDAVAAAMHRISYLTLTDKWDRSPQLGRTIYETETAFKKGRSWIENG